MAFERAKIEIKPASVGTGIKVTLAKIKGSCAKMRFTFSGAVTQWLGWQDGDKIEVMIGTGEHHGLLRVRKNASVGEAVLVHRKALKGGYFTINLGHQPQFVDRSEAGRWCQFEKVEDGFVEIVLPRWADETAPAKPKTAPLPIQKTQTHVPERPARDVTASIMGDPPAGRREMLAKVGDMKV